MRLNEPPVLNANDIRHRLCRWLLWVGIAITVLGLPPTTQAVVVFSESFETDGQGVRYTASDPFNVSQSDNGAYWDRGESADFNTIVPYTNMNGTFFWAGESVDWTSPGPGGNGNETQTLDFGPFDIEGLMDLQFTGLFASSATALGVGFPFDPGDGIKVQYSVDGAPLQDGLSFAPVNWPTLRNLAQDTNGDGMGDGAVLTENFDAPANPFVFSIPDGAILEIHIEVTAPASSQEVAFDLFEVTGEGGLAGDLDGDGFVGITDLNIVLSNWNQTVPPGDPAADPSGDDFVGIEDLNVVLGNWNAGTPPSDTANIPEPISLLLLAVGGVTLVGRSRGQR